MIPILYRNDEMLFTSNGIGRLYDCVSCTVTEERNGIYELEFEYPITGKLYHEMVTNGGIIGAIHDDKHDIQLFDIYAHTDPIDGIVTFNAHHISYRLGNLILKPFEGESVGDTLSKIPHNTMTRCWFSFWTNKPTSGEFALKNPTNVRSVLCGQQGSILDVYGTGDYEFDNYEVKLWTSRGVDTGVTIRYGKNMSDIENNEDDSGSYSAIVPYWVGAEGETVYGNVVFSQELRAQKFPWTTDQANYVEMENGSGTVIEFQAPIITPKAVDFSSEFQERPTVQELNAKAQSFIANNETWKQYRNIKVDFVQLWQTPEYENVASLQRVSLCDLVSVYFPEMGITQNKQKVIRVVYNVLLERYDNIELGQAKTTLGDLFETDFTAIELMINEESNTLREVIKYQTALITGGLGGYVIMNPNSNGEPQEILIMDTPDIETAVHVIRMNKNGIGFSNNGYAGPFESAWTIDGKFNANFIGAGTLLANYIKGGTMTLGGYDNIDGSLVINDPGGTAVTQINNAGITTNSLVASDYIYVDGTDQSYFKIPIYGHEYYGCYVELSPYGFDIVAETGHSSFYGNTGGLYTENKSDTDENASINYWGFHAINDNYEVVVYPERIELSRVNYTSRTRIYDEYILCNELRVTGNKQRQVKTEDYGDRFLYCYETPSPLFGDVGEGVIDETGTCYVFLDPVFAETISTQNYQVFLQKYGSGDCWVSERQPGYFVVSGESGLQFGWELKAKQADFDQLRIEKVDPFAKAEFHDYGTDAAQFIEELMKERNAA